MKTLEFYFSESGLAAAAAYLTRSNAQPVQGKTQQEVERIIKDASMNAFKKAYEGNPVNPYRVNDGVYYGSIVWRGLACSFSAVSESPGNPEIVDIDINETFSGSLSKVVVTFLSILG